MILIKQNNHYIVTDDPAVAAQHNGEQKEIPDEHYLTILRAITRLVTTYTFELHFVGYPTWDTREKGGTSNVC